MRGGAKPSITQEIGQRGDQLLISRGYAQPFGRNLFGFSVNCSASGNARNGTAAAPITIQAQNERRALIQGNGSKDDVIQLNYCGWWNIVGLRVDNLDTPNNSFQAGGVSIFSSHDVVFRRNLLANSSGVLAWTWSSPTVYNILIEENEIYGWHRNVLECYGDAKNCIIRRNYLHARGYAQAGGPQAGIELYCVENHIVENNIVEGSGYAFHITGGNNTVVGNVALGTNGDSSNGFSSSRHPQYCGNISGNVFKDNVAVGYLNGFASRSESQAKYSNLTSINALSGSYGFYTDNVYDSRTGHMCYDNSGTQLIVCPWNISPDISVTDSLMVSGAGGGFLASDINLFAALKMERVNAFNNSPNYLVPAGNLINAKQIDPALGSCRAWIPDASPMKRAGTNGADIGANILYRYQNGALTAQPLWNTATGQFPCGAVIAGVNDIAGKSCFDVHKRLNVNTNGCPFPSGYSALAAAPASLASPQTSAAITIDGSLSDAAWAQAKSASFSNSSRSDNQVTVYSLWDTSRLYLAFAVKDAQVEAANATLYEDDGIEVYLDTQNNKGASIDNDDYHLIVNISNVVRLYRADVTEVSGVLAKTVRTATGYTTEVAIPWSALNTTPAANKKIGLLLANNDRDNGVGSQFDWQNLIALGGYNRPNLWGDLQLGAAPADTTPPVVSLSAPANNAAVSGTVTISADATDNLVVTGVQFKLDGTDLGSEITAAPYAITWNSATASTGTHTLTASARDAAGNITTSAGITINVSRSGPTAGGPTSLRNLTAVAVSATRIALSWNETSSSTGVNGYLIYRDGMPIGNSATTNYVATGLSPATSYSFTVTPVDAAGNALGQSTSISAATLSSAPAAAVADDNSDVRGGGGCMLDPRAEPGPLLSSMLMLSLIVLGWQRCRTKAVG